MIEPVTDKDVQKIDLSTLKPNRECKDQLEIVAGPILKFWGLDDAVWRGTVTYVVKDDKSNYENFPVFTANNKQINGTKFYSIHGFSFFRYLIEIDQSDESQFVKYKLGKEHPEFQFCVPGIHETMQTMFYSCNGFSLAVDTNLFKGSLWDDVLAKHQKKPFHVMLGGGDQLYCDAIHLALPPNTMETRGKPKNEEKMRELMDKFYLMQYVNWYGRGYWKGSNGETVQNGWVEALATIPSVAIYDDHDMIDGFGTYKDSTMSRPVFTILGEYAFRYYMLFQQNVAVSNDEMLNDKSWITTGERGPFIHEPARTIYARLGKHAAFLGLDCRTERKKKQVCAPGTYDAVFERLKNECKDKDIKHIYLMLGVPIAYPRMVWAENVMTSRLIKPIKWLSKNGIILKGLVNPFDGEIELLDDLNDHWTAKDHKRERNHFLHRLMEFQREHKVRFTILTGDVHLCSVGVFRSGANLDPSVDPHFMVSPISSAIVNTPPPSTLADFMNKRNKTHVFRGHVLERNIPIFDKDVDGKSLNNKTCLARRNFLILDPTLASDGSKRYAGPQFDKDHLENPPKHDILTTANEHSVLMTINVEADQNDKSGRTVPYEMIIPSLQ